MMNVDKGRGDIQRCHPERSEGSALLARESLAAEILRFAQDDMGRVSLS